VIETEILLHTAGDAAMQGTRIDTRRVAGRRAVCLRTIDDLAAEVEWVLATDAAGKLQSLANWSPAQILWHIGRLIELSFDGFPFRYRRAPAWITRVFRLLAWRRLIALAFRPGFQNPSEAASLEPDPLITLIDAAPYLKHHLSRIQNGEQMTQECSTDGPYTHVQWVYIHLRHAELHLSFLAAKGK
jgi:hypothetical protein